MRSEVRCAPTLRLEPVGRSPERVGVRRGGAKICVCLRREIGGLRLAGISIDQQTLAERRIERVADLSFEA